MTDLPSARKSFYQPGEGISVAPADNTDGYWLLTAEELKTLMKY